MNKFERFAPSRHKRDAIFNECLNTHLPNKTFNFDKYLSCLSDFERRGLPTMPTTSSIQRIEKKSYFRKFYEYLFGSN